MTQVDFFQRKVSYRLKEVPAGTKDVAFEF